MLGGQAMTGSDSHAGQSVLSCLVVATILFVGCCGCSSRGPSCYPEQPAITPQIASAGGVLRVSSPGFVACRGHLPAGTRYTIDLYPLSSRQRIALGATPVARNGSFSTAVRVPVGTAPGQAMLLLDSDAFAALCHAASCPEYSSRTFTIAR
jgi:hypothetical protein